MGYSDSQHQLMLNRTNDTYLHRCRVYASSLGCLGSPLHS